MKVIRELKMKVPHFEIGDRVEVQFSDETHTATAYKQENDGMLFVMDNCLNERQPMNIVATNKGGFDESYLRKYLREKALELPTKFQNKLIPFENGDMFRLLRLIEVTGDDITWNKIQEPLEFFKNRKHLIAYCKDISAWSWYWLEDSIVTLSKSFATVDSLGIPASYLATNSYGVRPVFKIRNSKSKDL